MTCAQIAQVTGYSHGHVWKIVNRQDGPDKRWKLQAEKRAEIIAGYEAGEKNAKRLAEIYGVTYTQAKSIIERYAREKNVEQGMVALYPNIEKWRIENGMSHSALARVCGVCPTNMTNIIYGRGCDNSRGPTKMVIDRILEVTGLTYEEAFRRDIRRIEE